MEKHHTRLVSCVIIITSSKPYPSMHSHKALIPALSQLLSKRVLKQQPVIGDKYVYRFYAEYTEPLCFKTVMFFQCPIPCVSETSQVLSSSNILFSSFNSEFCLGSVTQWSMYCPACYVKQSASNWL